MIEQLRDLWHQQPFSPFTVHLADGRALAVPHPDFMWVSLKGGEVIIESEVDGRIHHLNPEVVGSVSRMDRESAVNLSSR